MLIDILCKILYNFSTIYHSLGNILILIYFLFITEDTSIRFTHLFLYMYMKFTKIIHIKYFDFVDYSIYINVEYKYIYMYEIFFIIIFYCNFFLL